jgi:cytochrome oxidase Cu insertion factor (SCO1/SenC/PrrC family)
MNTKRISIERLAGALLFVLAVVAIVSIVLNSLWQTRKFFPSGVLQTPLTRGAAAPPFDLESLTGENVSLGQFKGKPVLLMFWSTG